MNGPDRSVHLPADVAALVRQHFDSMERPATPISIRREVHNLRDGIGRLAVSDEDLIREVERHAVERGYSVVFDAHVDTGAELAR